MTATLFISIAAYREFELVNTVRDAIRQAASPGRLRFCICWQHSADESLDGLENDPRVDIIDVPHDRSQGVCWARNRIQQRYRGETYSLQIDGHHRFSQDWDQTLIDMLETLRAGGVAKPVLTGYLPAYDPDNDPAGRVQTPWFLGFDRFEPAGVVFMRPYTLPEPADAPVATPFWSAHFSFSDGCFNTEVAIDPHGYFHSEEIGTAVRAWTSGYDFHTPHRVVLWHEYTRKRRICHWQDHDNWGRRNARGIARYRALVGVDDSPRVDLAPYGLGQKRSLDDYQRFAGLCFRSRGVMPSTLAHQPPPAADAELPDTLWNSRLLTSYSLDIPVPTEPLRSDEPDLLLSLHAHAQDGRELARADWTRPQIDTLLQDQTGPTLAMLLAFCGREPPTAWSARTQGPTRDDRLLAQGPWPFRHGPLLTRLSQG